MKIGVIADTHIPVAAQEIPSKVLEAFKGADFILHAGDLIVLKVMDDLKKIAAVHAVSGNMDSSDVAGKLPAKKVVSAGKFKIGLIHGYGAPDTVIEAISKEFEGVDAIVFGHTHRPANELRKGVLFFNPGSPTDKVFAPYNSFGILYVTDKIKAEIIRL